MWGRWEKTGGGGGNMMYLLATVTLRTCTMPLIHHTSLFVLVLSREWIMFAHLKTDLASFHVLKNL